MLSTRLERERDRSVYNTPIQKFGYDIDLDTGDDVWAGSAPYTGFLSAAVSIEAISGDANDHATTSPTGARTIRVEGLDSNWDFQSVDIEMAGLSASAATTETFIRVTRAFVLTAGSSGHNEGAITVRVASAGASLAVIPATFGQTVQAIYTVPRKHVGLIRSVSLHGNSTQPVTFAMYVRRGADQADAARRLQAIYAGIDESGLNRLYNPGAIVIPEMSDVWIGVVTGANNGVASAEFELDLFGRRGCVQVPD